MKKRIPKLLVAEVINVISCSRNVSLSKIYSRIKFWHGDKLIHFSHVFNANYSEKDVLEIDQNKITEFARQGGADSLYDASIKIKCYPRVKEREN